MFENSGEWPVQRSAFLMPNGGLSAANMLNGAGLLNNNSLSTASMLGEQRRLMQSPMLDENDTDDLNEDEDVYSKNSDSKYQKPKRGRPPKLDLPQLASSMGISAASATALPADPANKIRNLLNSSDSSLDKLDEKKAEGKSLEPGEIFRPKGLSTRSKGTPVAEAAEPLQDEGKLGKRGRKSIAQKEPVAPVDPMAAQIQSLAALFLQPGLDPDERVVVINMENGTRLTGNKAPRRSELPMWLLAHPSYLPDESELLNLAMKNQMKPIEEPKEETQSFSKSAEKSLEKSKSKQQQQENESNNGNASNGNKSNEAPVVLINKQTNKKLMGPKVPNWKGLGSFLERNEHLFIDPSCNEYIRSRYGRQIPDIIRSRMMSSKHLSQPQKPSSSPPPSSSSSKSNQQQQQQQQHRQERQESRKSMSNASAPKASNNTPAPSFNPFSPNSINELMNNDMNNPLAGFMAALAGAGGAGAGLPSFGAPNPFLLPPFGLPSAAASNPLLGNPLLADLLSKMPPGFDMNSFDDLTALLAASLQGDQPTPINEPPKQESKPKPSAASNSNNNGNSS
jgi:hypothetical protein